MCKRVSGPIAAVSAVIVQDGQILLVKRGAEPNKGLWSLPGGAIELGETASDALVREVMEETGLKVEPLHVAYVHDVIQRVDQTVIWHYVIISYFASVVSGCVQASSDAEAVEWVPLDQVKNLNTTDGLLERLRSAGLDV
ncbi:MAG: NUDIX hydrolase [Armatimonadota bacterium]|nr:NUDIX hydrolase [Armatimonadota bacterium]